MKTTTLNKIVCTCLFLFIGQYVFAQAGRTSPELELDIRQVRSCSEERCFEPIDEEDPNSDTADKEIVFHMRPSGLEVEKLESITFTSQYIGLDEYSEIWLLEIQSIPSENIMVTNLGSDRYAVTVFYTDIEGGEQREGTEATSLPITTKRTASTKTEGPGKGLSSTGCYRILVEDAYAIVDGRRIELQAKSAMLGDCNSTGLSPINKSELVIKSYPNPAQNTINIEFNQRPTANIVVTDITGQAFVRTQRTTVDGKVVRVPLTHLPNGMYVIHVETSKSIVQQRFVVAR